MFMSMNIVCEGVDIFDEVLSQNQDHFLSDHRGIIVIIKI